MYKDTPSRAIAELASKQHGLVSREQAIGLGFTPARIGSRARAGEWERVRPGVYRLCAIPPSWKQDLMSACLSIPGGIASHTSAACLLKLDGVSAPAIEVMTSRPCNPIRVQLMVHRVKSLPREDTTVIDGIPCTRAARTIVDLASCLEDKELELALEDALRRRIVNVQWIRRRMRQLGSRGRCGARLLERLLSAREGGKELSDSALEMRVLQALRKARLPEPERQFIVATQHEFIAQVDFAYPKQRLIIEADGFRYHQGLKAWTNDRDRLSKLAATGWRVIHAKWRDVASTDSDFIERVKMGLKSARSHE